MSTTQPPVFAYHHTHWDREWYQSFRQYQVRLAEVVDTILDRLDTGVFSCFTLDGQTVLLDDYLEFRPWQRERLERWIGSGQLNIGPWYVMPDEFLVSGESLIRNLKKGIEMAQTWGCNEFTGYLPDTFGHSGDMPLIFNQFGIQTAMVWRGVAPQHSVFLWKSRNRAQVTTYFLAKGYFQNMLHDPLLPAADRPAALQSLFDGLKDFAGSNGSTQPILLPIGGDHLGPVAPEANQLLKQTFPELKEITAPRFFATLGTSQGLEQLTGELRDNREAFLLPGVFSARLYLKQANRKLEHRLTRHTEPLAAMARLWLAPAPHYPIRELEVAWQQLLLNHPHDSICGCSVDEVHRENEVRFDQVAALCDSLDVRYRRALSHGLTAFNLGDQPYSGVVPVTIQTESDSDALRNEPKPPLTQVDKSETILLDNYLTDIQDVPLSHLTVTQHTGWVWGEELAPHSVGPLAPVNPPPVCSSASVNGGGRYQLENDQLSVTVLNDGTLSVVERATGKTYAGLHELIDQADAGDSYNSAPVPGTPLHRAVLSKVEILRTGPLMATLRLEYRLPNQPFPVITEVSLAAGSNQLVFETGFTNRTRDHKLQVGFPTGAPVAEVLAESHLGIERRPHDPTYQEADRMPVEKNRELPTNTGPIQRFIQANGHLWITEGLTEYEVRQETVYLTLLRAFGYLSKGDTGVRGAQAGPPFATPEGQCVDRPASYRYAWQPAPEHVWQAYTATDRFYGVVFAEGITSGQGTKKPINAESRPASLVLWNNPHLVSTALKWADNGKGLLLRLVNTSHEQEIALFQTGFPFRVIEEVNFLEADGSVVESSVIPFAPFSVKTLLFHVQ
jgi:alpha-mannosidase